MSSATFFITHSESDSRAIVEFVTVKGVKVRLQNVAFIRGNVVSLNAIRECRKHAHHVLVNGG